MLKSFSNSLLINHHEVHGSRYFVASEQLCLLSMHPTSYIHTHTHTRNPLFSCSGSGEPELLTPWGCLGQLSTQELPGVHASKLASLPAHCLPTGPTTDATIRQLIFSVRKKNFLNINNMVYNDKSPLHFCWANSTENFF